MNIQLAKVTVHTLIKALKEQEDMVTDEIEAEDFAWQIFRLEGMPSGTKLVHLNDLTKVPKSFQIQEGYWLINGFAHYLAVPR